MFKTSAIVLVALFATQTTSALELISNTTTQPISAKPAKTIGVAAAKQDAAEK